MANEQDSLNLPTVSPEEVNSKIENEKLLPQSEVNSLIGYHKQKAYEKAKRDIMEEMARTRDFNSQQQPPNYAQSPNMNPNPSNNVQPIGAQDIDRHVQEAIEREKQRLAQENLNNAINNGINIMNGKMEAAKSKLPDYDAVVPRQIFNDPNHPYHAVMHTANQFPNGAEILYELAKNPSKLTTLKSLIMDNLQNPTLVNNEFKRLSDSISTNELASGKPLPPEPLTQVKPTPINAGSGNMSIGDYKKLYRR